MRRVMTLVRQLAPGQHQSEYGTYRYRYVVRTPCVTYHIQHTSTVIAYLIYGREPLLEVRICKGRRSLFFVLKLKIYQRMMLFISLYQDFFTKQFHAKATI